MQAKTISRITLLPQPNSPDYQAEVDRTTRKLIGGVRELIPQAEPTDKHGGRILVENCAGIMLELEEHLPNEASDSSALRRTIAGLADAAIEKRRGTQPWRRRESRQTRGYPSSDSIELATRSLWANGNDWDYAMRDNDFEFWMEQVYVSNRGTRLSQGSRSIFMADCRRVERSEGDLDVHMRTDDMQSLLDRLRYSKSDERNNRPARHAIKMTGSIHNQTASFRSAISRYRDFCRDWPAGGSRPEPTQAEPARPAPTTGGQAAWPTWGRPTEEDLLPQAHLIARFARFLHPDFVAGIARDNEANAAAWSAQLTSLGIDATLWLWQGSPSAFPGIRRYAGSAEIRSYREGGWRGENRPLDALLLDDNTYPKHPWSFAMRGRPFQNFGPDGYALAHLVDHKAHGDRIPKELHVPERADLSQGVPGLYASPTNVTYLPKGLLRPTDFEGKLRNLLQRRAAHLYGDTCALLPPGFSVRDEADQDWALDRFNWAEPVGDTKHLDAFLTFRSEKMQSFLDAATTSSQADTPLPFEVKGPSDFAQRLDLWATERLAFEEKGVHEAMRVATRAGLSRMESDPTQLLSAVYRSALASKADAENVLLYNVHTSEFRRIAPHAIRVERDYDKPPPSPSGQQFDHLSSYSLVSRNDESPRWKTNEVLASWNAVPLDPQSVTPHGVWAAMHQTTLEQLHPHDESPEQFALRLRIHAPKHALPIASQLIKPLVDGVVSAFHRHDGTDVEDVSLRLAARLPFTSATVTTWLDRDERSLLGTRRLLWPHGKGVQWNPADDLCVLAEVVVVEADELGAKDYTLAGRLESVKAAQR